MLSADGHEEGKRGKRIKDIDIIMVLHAKAPASQKLQELSFVIFSEKQRETYRVRSNNVPVGLPQNNV